MENLVFTTFANEKDAREALQKLHELDQLGDIIIYNIALVKKEDGDHLSVLHHEGPDLADFPAQGAVAGSLIGLLAGPIGLAIGMLIGTMAGAANEDESEEVIRQFLDKTRQQLQPGGFAIVLDVEEDTTFMIDRYLTPYHGITIRSSIEGEYDKYDSRQWEDLNAGIAEEEKALKTSVEKDKAQLSASLDALKKKRKELQGQIKEKLTKRKKHPRS